jgi:hypothetical protein
LRKIIPSLATLAALGALSAGAAWAASPKQPTTPLDLKEFFGPELYASSSNFPLEVALPELANRASWEAFLAQRGEDPLHPRTKAFIDPRSGAVSNLLDSVPLVPGRGAGNTLTSAQPVDARRVEAALRSHVGKRADLLGIDVAQLGEARVTEIHADLWQVSIPQRYRGVEVRDARLLASISHGNLVLIGTESWGNVRGLNTTPRLSAAQALDAGFAYADGRRPEDLIVRNPRLEIVPIAPQDLRDGEGHGGPIGQGYGHRLVWSFVFQRPPENARWEVLVDANDGEVLAFRDTNQYLAAGAWRFATSGQTARTIKGGVYPLTNTEICPNPDQCGILQSTWPMPFADTGFPAPDDFANSAGVYAYTSGTATTTLTGKHVEITDACGPISNSSPTGDIDLGGVNGDHDCTSGGGSPGNTAAARTTFYQVNKIAEMARGYLPGNAWLAGSMGASVNENSSCSGHWNGTGNAIELSRANAGCGNLGENAGVIDHEWGHGLDDNDANGSISNSPEGYADIAANYRLEASCVGHGFFEGANLGCGMTQDGTGFNGNEAQVGPSHCALDCSGPRDSDWAKHAGGVPDTALGFVCSSCSQSSGPCGRQAHCAGAPQRQAAWDLVARDLTAPPFGMNSQTAFITGNRLFYLGSGNIGLWYSCNCTAGTSDGCGAASGYMQWLAADDDDGNIANGTPHMTAIHAAFNRHGIACGTPAPQNSGCAGGPTGTATLTATPGDNAVSLSWTAVPGATGYWVYRTEGHAGCNLGKVKIADVTGLGFTDGEVANGREYYYNVVAHGPSQSCFGPASNCANVTPQPPQGGELLVNGGFEGGTCDPWVLTGTGVRCRQGGPNPHGGAGYVELGGQVNRNGRTFQEVAIPPGAPAELTFWLNVATSETGPTADDVMRVEVRSASDVLLATVATFSNLDAAPYSPEGPFSLAAFAGQTIRLYFRATNNGSLPTTFRLDDVSLQ